MLYLFLTNMQLVTSQDRSRVDYLWIILYTVWTLILMAPINCRESIGAQVV